ncbi:MAG TPA: ACP S-malonyltransferase [Pseudomonadales bacterium]|jgi:[acyl-carrier-protein] S-malonyltransferase|nr:ACP S-malonyltransferase [Pseudomonadales bacterium]HNL92202.1 ACP S-malonyltransferase [Pseudomonadales bacterium]HNN86212.1 ACP S-malonyltransferase [Pseudomonadales bacterium]
MSSNLAFVFSGQGSQKVGMLAEMAAAFPSVQKTFAEASEVLGYNLWDLCQNGEQEQLNATETTQPLLLTSSVALWRVWQEKNGKLPALLAGHSLGEWSALVCANVLDFSDAVDLVRKRGAYMQTAVPKGEGSMAAVLNVEDEKILALCKEASAVGVVEAVNFNSPGQVVIAGQVAAVDKASELLKAAGAKRVLPLPVSAPFHTSLMKPAAENMAKHIAATIFRAPTIPVVHNVNAKTSSDPEAIKALMIQQIDHPVLWVDCVKTMVSANIKTVVECGPGKVLCGLCTRIEKELTAFGIEDVAGLEKALAEI